MISNFGPQTSTNRMVAMVAMYAVRLTPFSQGASAANVQPAGRGARTVGGLETREGQVPDWKKSTLGWNNSVFSCWRPSSTAWKTAVRRTNDLLGLADRFVELEGAVSVWALSDLYLEARWPLLPVVPCCCDEGSHSVGN